MEAGPAGAPQTYALELEQVRKIYPQGQVEALKGLTFSVERGDFFALLGNNGAGKSTAIGIVSGLVSMTSGCVRVMGIDISEDHPRARRLIGLVPQEFNFSHFEKVQDIVETCAGYYGLSRRQAAKNTEKYLKLMGIWDKRKEVARNLSGGMKRRLMIARALVHEPGLLILDEPSAGVDVHQRLEVWKFLKEINASGTTIILTTHYLEEAETLCQNLAIISAGQIVEFGSMRSALAHSQATTIVMETVHPVEKFPELPEGFNGYFLDGALCVSIPEDKHLNTLISKLEAQDIQISSMSQSHSRLEALFLNRTKG